jgi:hypothetical protein
MSSFFFAHYFIPQSKKKRNRIKNSFLTDYYQNILFDNKPNYNDLSYDFDN